MYLTSQQPHVFCLPQLLAAAAQDRHRYGSPLGLRLWSWDAAYSAVLLMDVFPMPYGVQYMAQHGMTIGLPYKKEARPLWSM